MTDDAWPVRTARLEIRRASPDDLDAIWAYRRLTEVNNWLGGGSGSLDSFRERLQDPDRLSTLFAIALLPRGDGDAPIIGDIMVRIGDGWSQREVADQAAGVEAELGWALAPEFTGRGYATEAVRAAIDVCFGRLGLRRVHAGCFAANEPSWRLMERLGMRREEFSRKTALHRSGEWMDGMNYGILAEEWPPAG
ncbi:GNAT family N-acetyltransferase [Microbacterium sp. NPDC056234]|uniref:GNAT family N-acetyltransferase n=1 Tax=Microbacterium sp. NPDC056234 TaxID=3345757 RepID=UPI0035D6A62F